MGSSELLLKQLKNTFVGELPERIDEIERKILAFGEDASSQEALQEVYRKVHSLKGSGGTYGFQIITSICHQLEDALTLWDEELPARNTETLMARCLGYVDLLRQTHQAILSSDLSFATIAEKLHQHQKRYLASKLRCLLVEGSRTSREICQQTLAQYNVEVVVMEDGYEALGRLLNEKFDLLVVGMEIGLLNGATLVAAVKLSGKLNKDMRTVILTSSPNSIRVGNRITDPNLVVNKGLQMIGDLKQELESLQNQRVG